MVRSSWSQPVRKNYGDNYWYRSKSVRSAALGQHQRDIYVARVTIPDEFGFSQADLAGLLEQMKKQVADLERITGRITGTGIALSGSGKGATASFKILLRARPIRRPRYADARIHSRTFALTCQVLHG